MTISAPGVGLPYPQAAYPVISGSSYSPATVRVALAAGQQYPIPAGNWLVTPGLYSVVQWFDPVTGAWRGFNSARNQPKWVRSDGFNFRVANLTGCPVTAVVTNGGSGYSQATTTCVASAGGSLWTPIVGGTVNTSVTINTAGSGYTLPPICYIPAPPAGLGVPATAYATLTTGTVTSITVTNQGAGYTAVPPIILLPNPADPNIGSIVAAVATLTLVAGNAAKVTALICTNNGAPQSSAPTLTIAGAGSSAAATAVMMWTATGVAVGAGGSGISTNNEITSVGGQTAASPVFTNPAHELTSFVPRKASMLNIVSAGAATTSVTIYDGGLFTGTPGCLLLAQGITGQPTVTFSLGNSADTIELQPIPG